MLSLKVKKINRFKIWQERSLMLTTQNLCNVRQNNEIFRRSIRVNKLGGLTKRKNNEQLNFIVHVKDEYDYLYKADNEGQQKEIFNALKDSYFKLMNDNLPIYEVPGELALYTTTKSDAKNHLVKIPGN